MTESFLKRITGIEPGFPPEHPFTRAIHDHPEIFTEMTQDEWNAGGFEERIARWMEEFPEEWAAYEESHKDARTLPMPILDHWNAIEEMAAKYPELDIVAVVDKWIAENPEWESYPTDPLDEDLDSEV